MSLEKKVLDATCGSRMIWFDKDNPIALYVDRRVLEDEAIWTSGNGKATRFCTIKPDVVADFTSLPFADETFWHVVFDPPHLLRVGDSAWLAKKYGKLPKNWQGVIKAGFDECWRVLKQNGTLVFKWCETDIAVKDIIKAIGKYPMYGNRCGKQGKTHWMIFYKE